MGRLCGTDVPPKWTGSTKPEWSPPLAGCGDDFIHFLEPVRSSVHPFRQRCRRIVQDTPLESVVTDNDKWREFVGDAMKQFRDAYKEWEEDYISLRNAWIEIPKQPLSDAKAAERAKANSIRYQMRAISDITVIEWLSDAGFLPRYGFPIHLQRLSVRKPRDDRAEKSTTAEVATVGPPEAEGSTRHPSADSGKGLPIWAHVAIGAPSALKLRSIRTAGKGATESECYLLRPM